MRLTRILLLVVVAAAVAGVFVPKASALAFADNPCPITVPSIIKVCPVGQTGKTYGPLHIDGRDGTGCYPHVKYSVVGDTALPPGLSLSSDGWITGTPTTAGNYLVWLQMQDTLGSPSWCSDSEATQRQFEFDVVAGLQIAQRQSTLTPAQLNTAYNLQLTANGAGSSTLQWSVPSGSLPAGISLNGSTGLLSGTATTKGDYQFQVKVTDGTRSDVQTYTLSVIDPLKITSSPAAAGELGQDFQTSLTANGGKQPYTWALANGASLPEGLKLDPATGAITGTPTAAGVAPVKVTVTDSAGLTQTLDLQIVVAQELSLVKRSLRTAKVGHAYSARLFATGGVAPKSWTIVAGSLPAGLHLNAKSGHISGTPRRGGTSHVTVQVTDKLGAVSKATFTLKVHA